MRLKHLSGLITAPEQESTLRREETLADPDFDDGWVELDPYERLEWRPDEHRPVARVDVLRKTGPDSFELVPRSRPESDTVWPAPRRGPDGSVTHYVIYNVSSTSQTVRVQGWYG
jgi:hypothetical protein